MAADREKDERLYITEGRIAEIELKSQDEINRILAQLVENGYKPTIRTLGDALLSAVSSEHAQGSASTLDEILDVLTRDGRYPRRGRPAGRVVGDILLLEERAVLIQPIQKSIAILEVRRHDVESGLDEFCALVTETIKKSLGGTRTKGMSFSWRSFDLAELFQPRSSSPTRFRRRNAPRAGLSSQPAALDETDLESVELLRKQRFRDFVRKLTQLGKAKSDDARRDVEADVIEPLLANELVRREFLVQCRRDSGTLCTTEKREDVEEDFGAKLKCTTCGRTYSEELIEEIYAPTARAKQLLDASHWMTLLVTKVLVDAGIKIADIEWGATAGEDEIDLVVKIKEFTVFFELKDREFGLGDAYPFSSRIQRYGADMGVIVSADAVAEEVRKYFAEESELNVRAVEGLDDLNKKLSTMIDEISQSSISEEIGPIYGPIGSNVSAILESWFRCRRGE